MFDLNPFIYGSVDYCEYEMQSTRRNLDLVIAGAKNTIDNPEFCKGEQDFVNVCETVVIANEKYLNAVKSYDKAKVKESNPNE